jgi:hypothetical protein
MPATRPLSCLEVGEASPRDIDFSLLPLAARVDALVVAGQEQNDPMAVGMTEHPQEHRTSSGRTG